MDCPNDLISDQSPKIFNWVRDRIKDIIDTSRNISNLI